MSRQAAIWTVAGTVAGTSAPERISTGKGRQVVHTAVIKYEKILAELEVERSACQYAYGGMVPAFYTQALHRATEAIKECQDCAAEARCMAKEVSQRFQLNENV